MRSGIIIQLKSNHIASRIGKHLQLGVGFKVRNTCNYQPFAPFGFAFFVINQYPLLGSADKITTIVIWPAEASDIIYRWQAALANNCTPTISVIKIEFIHSGRTNLHPEFIVAHIHLVSRPVFDDRFTRQLIENGVG